MPIIVDEEWLYFGMSCRHAVPMKDTPQTTILWCTHPHGGHSCNVKCCPRKVKINDTKE